jgi:hypothetical protein
MANMFDSFKSFLESSFDFSPQEQKQDFKTPSPEQSAKDEFSAFESDMESFYPVKDQEFMKDPTKGKAIVDFKSFVDDWAVNYQTQKDPKKINRALETLNKFDFKSIPLEALNAIKTASSIFEKDAGQSIENISNYLTNVGAVESKYQTKKQLSGGPARSFWQVEPVTAKDILTNAPKLFGEKFEKNFTNYAKQGKSVLKSLQSLSEKELSNLLETDDNLAATIAAAKFIQTRPKK